MKTITLLLKHVQEIQELLNCMQNINYDVEHTFKECCDFTFNDNLKYEPAYFFKIDSVIDFLNDELNTGHWSDVFLSIRQAFSGASFIKTVIILKDSENNPKTALEDALKSLDRGLLLGAPFNKNEDLLTQSATVLSQELNQFKVESIKDCNTAENKRKDISSHKEFYDTLKAKEILILQCPSIESFNKTCFVPQAPVKLQDCMTHWPASKKWLDVNYLLKIAGNRTVPIEIGSHYTDENWTQKLMSLKDFIHNHYLGDSESIGYLAQHNLFDQIAELKEDICVPEYCALSRDYDNTTDPDINAWFGPKGTVSPVHYDPKDNLLAQVFGTKQIVLYPPSDSEYLYPHDDKLLFNTAQVDPINPDILKYPKYSSATPYKCLLEAGEILYIPIKWWHHVNALDKSFSVSFWWQ